MRNNNLNINNCTKPNNYKNFPKYCFTLGFGLVSHTLSVFNLFGYNPGHKYGFKNKIHKNSTLLRLLGNYINSIHRLTKSIHLHYTNAVPIPLH